MPRNVKRLALSMSPLHVPELIPGLPLNHEFRFRNFRHTFDTGGSFPILLIQFALGVTWFAPAWVYRAVLKSTLWIWWILLFVGGAPDTRGGILRLRSDAYLKVSSWASIVGAIFVLAITIVSSALLPVLNNALSAAPLPSAVVLLFKIDLKVSVFQALYLASASLTIYIVVTANSLSRDSYFSELDAETERGVRRLGYIINLKRGIGWGATGLLMLYIALYANVQYHWFTLTSWENSWLEVLYGPNAEPLAAPGSTSH